MGYGFPAAIAAKLRSPEKTVVCFAGDGCFLMSAMDRETSILAASGIMALLGLGLGMVMQVLLLAAQNAVDYRDLGVATSGATLFRLAGGSIGPARPPGSFEARPHNSGVFERPSL